MLFIPGMAPIVIAGPITEVLASWIEGKSTGGDAVGGLAGPLGGLGIPKHEILMYEAQIHAGEFIILVTGSDEDIIQTKQMLDKISYENSMSVTF
ncbi:hypothetical protein [Neosynechococcus sphagnicola]|uniref:hypothetical protein n=1 Tax=Neosynechococcus sphagnicola TaxID=1501145 RepID=UPI0019554047|nr:hypothetical protein [Neosynechococcus sphagnicola]